MENNSINKEKLILTENDENSKLNKIEYSNNNILNTKYILDYLSLKNKNIIKVEISYDENSNNLIIINLENNIKLFSFSPDEIISQTSESSIESNEKILIKTKLKLTEDEISQKEILKIKTFSITIKKLNCLSCFFYCKCSSKKIISPRQINTYYFLINKKKKENFQKFLNQITLPKLNELNSKNRKRKLLIFINPIGGKGNAIKIWEKANKILSEIPSISLEIIYTSYFKNAYDIILKKKSLYNYDGIITCSGDGILHEVINAIFHREDCDILINKLIFSSLPAGSGNAFSKNISYYNNEKNNLIENQCYYIIKGIYKKIDLLEYELRDFDKKIYSFLTLTWSFISDCDLESEFLRCLGEIRVTLMGVIRWVCLRKYYGTLYYSNDNNIDLNSIPSIHENLNENDFNLIKENDQYNLFVANNMKWVSEDHFPSYKAELDDGYVDILYLKGSDSGKYILFKELLFYFDNGNLIYDNDNKLKKGIHYIKTKFWRLIPKNNLNDPDDVNIKYNFNTFFAIDGEKYPICPVQCKVLNKVISAYSGKE